MEADYRVLGIIPARGGSKGIPGKNIKLLNGKPLIQYAYESACQASLLTETILSTDDKEIREIGQDLGIHVPFLRPANLADDHAPALGYLIHAVEWMKSNGKYFDAVCILQPTTPFRAPGLVDKAIRRFHHLQADSLVTVLPVPHELNPHWVFEADNDGFLHISTGEEVLIPRRQELPPAYFRDGAVYLTKTEVLLNQESIYGKKISYLENSSENYVNLDTMEDWNTAEHLISKLNNS